MHTAKILLSNSHVGVHCMSVSVGVTSTDWLLVTSVLHAGVFLMQDWQMQRCQTTPLNSMICVQQKCTVTHLAHS